MIYYVKENDLYSSDTPIIGEGFEEITQAEYESRIDKAVNNREVPQKLEDDACEVI